MTIAPRDCSRSPRYRPVSDLPRTPSRFRALANGKPDLSGVWQGGGVSLYGEPGLSTRKLPPPVNPPPKREPVPYQTWAETKTKTFTAADDPTLRCLLPGVPRITTMPMPFEIVEKPKRGRDRVRIVPRVSHHPDQRQTGASQRSGSHLDGRFGGALGWRHAGDRRHRLQRQDLAGRNREFSQRSFARGGALHAQ